MFEFEFVFDFPPSLDRAPATELGGDGFPESLNRPDVDPFTNPFKLALLFPFPLAPAPAPLPFTPFGPKEPLGTPEVGGVARLLRFEKVGENGGSDFWYWLMPDQSLPSTETGDMAPELPFMGDGLVQPPRALFESHGDNGQGVDSEARCEHGLCEYQATVRVRYGDLKCRVKKKKSKSKVSR